MELKPSPVEWPSFDADGLFIEQFVRTRFSDANFESPEERADRIVEEALEYQQAVYGNRTTEFAARANRILNRVISRDIGDPSQELAGVLATVLAAARQRGQDLPRWLDMEYRRIAEMPADHFREKYLDKVAAGTAR